MPANRILLFTKSWPKMNPADLASFVADLGFDGIELPVRDGYPVNPENVLTELVRAAEEFRKKGIVIGSVAGALDEGIIRSMGEAGISILRLMPGIDNDSGYFGSIESWRDRLHRFGDILERSGVRVGFQNHQGNFVGSAIGLHHLLQDIPDTVAGMVLDPGHCGLVGEPVNLALDIARDRLLMLNFKNAYRHRISGTDEPARWQSIWTSANQGYVDWEDAINRFKALNTDIDICVHAEYGRVGMQGQLYGDDVLPLLKPDFDLLKNLLR